MILTSPLALLGLAAAATPVVIYLLLRRRKTEVDWGASYLLRLTLRSKRRASIWRQMLVLALRVLVLALGAILLTGLMWPNPQPSRERPALPPDPVHRAILVDNSSSMTASADGRAGLTRMQAAVDALLTDLRVGDRATVIPLVRGAPEAANDEAADDESGDDRAHTLSGPLSGRERWAAIEGIPVSPGQVGLGEALATGLARLARTPQAVAELYVLSDFPRRLAEEAERLAWFEPARGRRGITVVPVSLAGSAGMGSYVALKQIGIGSDLALLGVPVDLYVEASCYGPEGMTATFVCEADGAEAGRLQVTFKANETRRFALPLQFDRPGEAVLRVHTDDSRLPAHAARSLCVQVKERLKVWVVAEEAGSASGSDLSEDEFIRRAYDPLLGSPAAIELVSVRANALAKPISPEVDVILVCAPRFALAAVAEPLTRFVERGGGLILAATAGMELKGYNEHYGELLPADFERAARTETDPQEFSLVRSEVEAEGALLFAEFGSAAGGDLGDVRVYNHLTLSPDRKGEVLFRLSNDDPLLARRALGRGWVHVWTSGFGIAWTSMPVRQSFLPFLTRLLHAAAGGRVLPRNLDPGASVILPWPHAATPRLQTPDGRSRAVEPVTWNRVSYVVLPAPATPGLYRLSGDGGDDGTGDPALAHFTVRGELPERDLRSLDQAGLEKMAGALGAPIHPGWARAVVACGPADAFAQAWPWLLAAMLALYLVETRLVRIL